ncbi:MucB/RseB C-terminal domain-containing protein [Thalassotalea sp. PLHSN55]|uniref:MucB/RseB C-terminal domain-containing protein n=1 Tax=Thalassotalea sp. PLHSN55 TaxID=3435888 RepID=UPI003F85F338
MKSLSRLLLLVVFCFPAAAYESEQAKPWLERLSKSLQELNFTTSFVVVKNNQAEPYHWFHGVDEENTQLELLSLLNGPRRDILRKGNVVSYIEPELPPYSVISERISGPIPAILSQDISALEQSYRFVPVGRNRVLGRSAQLVRIVSKDKHRFGHWLWLDQETGLLLKLAVITRQGQLLEQVQFTHLDITDTLPETLKHLVSSELPPVIDVNAGNSSDEFIWQVNWMPSGFKQIASNRHRISVTKKPVEFILFSDGLVDISVYVSPSENKQRAEEYVMDGATVALNKVVNGIEISVVGKIPVNTAKAIVNSVALER